jgi:hypothetical protein
LRGSLLLCFSVAPKYFKVPTDKKILLDEIGDFSWGQKYKVSILCQKTKKSSKVLGLCQKDRKPAPLWSHRITV